MKNYFIGIDPGKTGAVAVLDAQGELVSVHDFCDALDPLISMRDKIAFGYLEEVHAMPKQGVVSTFTFGENFGWWKGVLTAMGVPFKTIRPQEWQKGLVPKRGGLTDKPSLDVARQIFTTAPLGRKKDHNRADALLIALVCQQKEKVPS